MWTSQSSFPCLRKSLSKVKSYDTSCVTSSTTSSTNWYTGSFATLYHRTLYLFASREVSFCPQVLVSSRFASTHLYTDFDSKSTQALPTSEGFTSGTMTRNPSVARLMTSKVDTKGRPMKMSDTKGIA